MSTPDQPGGNLRDRNVIITGASRGIGAALAERLCAEGANVALVARTAEHHDHLAGSLAETEARCARYETRVTSITADLTDEQSRATIVPRALEFFDGRIDVLINNAAASIHAPISTMPLKRRRLMFEVNVHAPIDLAQAVITGMAERGEGWIINVSSASAKHNVGPPFRTAASALAIGAYGASKAALNRETNALAAELYASGIRVNTVEPRAAVMSEGADALIGGTIGDDLIESMEAMVEAIMYLCSCPLERSGQVLQSLDLLDELGRIVMNLDGRTPYPGGQRVYRQPS
jgi:citronellol/citronellal dehydrogenase